jgi:FkbM family methyltransferase
MIAAPTILKRLVKSALNGLGFDLVQLSNSPSRTLLGLCNIQFDSIIDIGANTGQFARTMRRFFPRATIYCFEPLPQPYISLSKWAATQDGRVKPIQVALGDYESSVEMNFHFHHSPSSSLLPTTALAEKMYPAIKEQKSVMVRQTTLDHAIAEFNVVLGGKSLVKLDVQGFEDRVLQGGHETFTRASACILEVSIDQLYASQPQFKDLLLRLDGFQYRYVGNLDQTYANDGHCVFFDALFIKEA